MYHVFDVETGMFYTGNNLGAKRMLSFGCGFDDPSRPDTDSTFVGVNYRMKKYERVLRLAWGQLGTDGQDDREVLQLTLQIFHF